MALLPISGRVSSLMLVLLELRRVRRHLWVVMLACCDPLAAKRLHVVQIMRHIHDQGFDLTSLWLLVDVLNKVALALNSTKGNLTYLLAVERLPRLVVHILVEGHYVDWIDEVNEGVADIAPVIKIERQVEKVEAAFVSTVNSLQ